MINSFSFLLLRVKLNQETFSEAQRQDCGHPLHISIDNPPTDMIIGGNQRTYVDTNHKLIISIFKLRAEFLLK